MSYRTVAEHALSVYYSDSTAPKTIVAAILDGLRDEARREAAQEIRANCDMQGVDLCLPQDAADLIDPDSEVSA